MLEKKIFENDIYIIAESFRSAIIVTKQNGEFSGRDRISNFPNGCCDDVCDLLAHFLYDRFKIYTMQRNGVYRDGNPNNTTNHAWLVMNDTIIDITGDQFMFCSKVVEEVYVGKENSFYEMLEDKYVHENYDITDDKRLLNDYQIIISNMLEDIF